MTTVDELLVRLFRVPRIMAVQRKPSVVQALLRQEYECQVDTASDSKVAIDLMAEHSYDLIIIDVSLLNGTSRKVLEAAQKLCPVTPVVVMDVAQVDLNEITEGFGPLTILDRPLTVETLSGLFRLFRIKAKTRAIAEHCACFAEEEPHQAAAV